ncbi:caspase family protein [Duganella sp. BuS-21]|uniref:nSTAND1 domain-containing NTPase n=1 Tax=Duganella sp. BuS-21 TaxID=2943848 RepID=UPI0035A59076
MSLGGFGHSRAVLIAVDQYSNGIPPLLTPVADATALACLLRDAHGYEVELLTDAAATLQGIRTFMERFTARIYPDDRVLFYFAGHGIATDSSDGPRGYVLPHDARKDGDAEVSFLPMVELEEMLASINCHHMFVILDCCFAGALRWSSTRHAVVTPGPLHQERLTWYVQDPAWQALASAAHDQRALDVAAERPLGKRDDAQAHSPFAAALIKGLEGEADLPTEDGRGDGVITATELYLYIDGALRQSAIGNGARQTPILWPMRKHDKGQYIFQTPNSIVSLPSAPPLNSGDNPWRGLEAYHEQHQRLFFGRAASIRRLTERWTASATDSTASVQLLVVIGPSGIGKSSLVGAGVIPRLREKGCRVIQVRPGVPSSSPFVNLAAALAEQSSGIPVGAEQLQAYPSALATWANGAQAPLVLVVDQAEEMITLQAEGDLGQRFLELIEYALTHSKLQVVMTLRSEYEPQLSQSALRDRWAAARFLVPRMTQDDFRRVIEAPVAVRVMRFESDELVDQLINDVINMPGALPLLSFALSQMYLHFLRRRSGDRTLTRADYDSLQGGVTGALRVTANAIVDGGDDKYADTARRVLLRFVAIERGEFSRRRVAKWELTVLDVEEQRRINALLLALTGAALIISDSTPLVAGGVRDEGGQHVYYELAHDALILGWERLNHWIREDTTKVLALRKLTQAAAEWEHTNHLQDELLWADPLRSKLVQQFSQEYAADANAVEAQFIAASLRRQTSNRRRRRAALAAAAIVMVGLLSALSAAWVQFGNKQVAQSLKLANVSAQLADKSDYARAALVAAAALPRPPLVGEAEAIPEVEDALYTAVSNLVQRHVLSGHLGPVNSARLSVDEKRLITGSRDTTVKLWSLKGGPPLWSVKLDAEVLAVSGEQRGVVRAVTKKGTIVELALADGTLKVLKTLPGEWRNAEFSRSGEAVMMAENAGGKARLAVLRGAALDRSLVLGLESEISTHQWHAKDDVLAIALSDGIVNLLDATNQVRRFNPGGETGKQLKFLEARHALLVNVQEGYWEWRYASNTKPVFHRMALPGWPLAVSADGEQLATGHIDGCVRIWQMTLMPELVATLNTPCKGVGEYMLTPATAEFVSEDEVLVSSMDRTASIWGLPLGIRQQLFATHNARIGQTLYSRKEQLIVTIASDSSAAHDVYVWKSTPLLIPQSLTIRKKDDIGVIGLSEDGRLLGAVTTNGVARIWALDSQASFEIPAPRDPVALNFSDDNQSVVIRSGERVVVGRPSAGVVYEGPSLDSGLHSDWIRPACIVAPSRAWQRFDVIRLSDGQRIRPPTVALGLLLGAAEASPGCKKVAFTDGAWLYVQDLTAPFRYAAWRLPEAIRAVAWSPSSRQLFAMTASYVYIFQRESGKLRGIAFGNVEQLVFSSDGRHAALRNSSDWMTVDLQATTAGVVTAFFDPATPSAPHSDAVTDIRFSPDGEYIVTAAGDFTAKIWETATGKHVRTFRGHGDYLTNARFSPDGRKLLTTTGISEMGLERQNPGIYESQVMLWDVASGKPIARMETRAIPITQALFARDGRTIFSASFVKDEVRGWRVFDSVDQLRDFACEHIDARLSHVETLTLIGADVKQNAGCVERIAKP